MIQVNQGSSFCPFGFSFLSSDDVLPNLRLVTAFFLDEHCELDKRWLFGENLVEPAVVRLKGIVSTIDNL